MAKYIDIEGDRWVVTLDRRAAHPGMEALVFNCISDAQRPYRVIEVPASREDEKSGGDFSERELRDLFGNSQTMDYTWDEAAAPGRHGGGRQHLE